MSDSHTRTDRIRETLTRVFAPTLLQVQDDSARHAGHSGLSPRSLYLRCLSPFSHPTAFTRPGRRRKDATEPVPADME
jgi:stress-induced morphogen